MVFLKKMSQILVMRVRVVLSVMNKSILGVCRTLQI